MKTAAKAGMVVALVFIAGFLSGIGAVACYQALRSDRQDGIARMLSRQPARYTPRPVERLEQLARELELTAAQREQFEPILHAGMEKIRILRQKHRPEVRAVLIETRTALCSILDEKQCRRFDELSRHMGRNRDLPGFGRCLEEYPDKQHRRGSGRGRRMEQEGSGERRRYQ